MNLLISGSSGLIGSALSRRLEAHGHKVIALVRPGTKASSRASVAWDPKLERIDLEALSTLDPIDCVIHLAGAGVADKRWNTKRKEEILESRVRSTGTLARTIAAMSPRPATFISASAIGFYGNRGDELLDETSAQGSGFLAEVCAAWEQATTPAQAAGVRVVHLRTGIVLETSGGALAKQLPLFKAGVGGKLGSGKQWMSWISMDDELRAIEAVLQNPAISGPVNLTAPGCVTNADFTKSLGHVLRRPVLMSVPKLALATALGSELVEEAILASQRVTPSVLLDAGFSFDHPQLEGALAALLS